MGEEKSTKNRKQRRFEAKLKRSRRERTTTGVSHWVRRVVNEMKDNPAVMEKVASGGLDKYLK